VRVGRASLPGLTRHRGALQRTNGTLFAVTVSDTELLAEFLVMLASH
jgi:hypothetical protein